MVSNNYKPDLCWLDTEEIETGYFEPKKPDLDQLLQIPDQRGYIGRSIQIVRGNILRGRPKLPDSLNIRYLDHPELPVNATLCSGPRCLCLDGLGEGLGQMIWRGPVVAYLKVGNAFDAEKMTDMNLTAYRDAIDYLAYFRDTIGSMIDPVGGTGDLFEQRIMASKSGKVKGVRINCIGDQSGDSARQFVQVDVPRAHPLFGREGDDPLSIAECFDEAWVAYRYKSRPGQNDEATRNPYARMLMLNISRHSMDRDSWATIPEWRRLRTTGSLLLVDRRKGDLDVRRVQAVCRLLEERVMPLLASGQVGREAIVDTLSEEALEQYL